MRRGTILNFLSLALLAGGVYVLADALSNSPSRTISLRAGVLGIILLTSAAGVAWFSASSMQKGCRELRRQLDRVLNRQQLLIDCPHPDLRPLVSTINHALEAVQNTIKTAGIKTKELEIQLKVATAERQHAEAIIYSISDAVLVTDRFDELMLANDAAARTFDFDLNRAQRSPIDQVLHDPRIIEMVRDMRQSDSKSGRRIVEHRLNTPTGERTFKVTLSTVADQSEPDCGVVAVLHDMTKEKEVAQMKNDFVSNVSHELRTPLASIRAYIEMLIDGEAEDEKTKTEFYDIIQNEANRLGRLIDNILNISRIESGLVKIDKQPQSLMVIVKDAIEVIAPQAALKNIKLEEKLGSMIYQTMADKDMLYQAVLNLLSNAVKYTPDGGTITVQTEVDVAKHAVVTKISDSGVGIPPKDLPYVFDKFYRAEANNRMAKGTGLGLSLVKHIIEAVHQGRIIAESEVGKGSTFGFELELID
ncbi:MAG: PAS domain-containing protein [Phycisphaerales bacterium]|nr:PAS domain-containing protein [Phycisphaerales bacterium]